MSWAHYILQVNIYLVVFYGFYKLLLDKETYFVLNRIYLLAAGLLSLSIPFLRLDWFATQPMAQTVYTSVEHLNTFVTQIAVAEPKPETISIGDVVVLIYLTGFMFFSLRLISQLLSLRNLFKKTWKGTAFSFFGKKTVDQQLPDYHTIEKHEEVHMRQLHSLDVLFFEVIGIITWFNPITYLYKTTVKNIHEFLADEEAAKFQGDKAKYAMLLLSTAMGVAPSTLTNNFYSKSLIKKRIYMLHKQRSAKMAVLKYGLFVPLFGITLLLSSATIRDNKKIQQIAQEIPLDQPLEVVKETLEEKIIAPVTKQIANPKPTISSEKINDDWQDFYTYIGKSTRYPAAAQQSKIQGNTQVKFSIKNGEMEGLGIVGKPLGYGIDAEVMSRLLAYKDYKTKPNGNYTFNVSFRLAPSNATTAQASPVALEGYTNLEQVVVVGFAPDEKGNAADVPLKEVIIQVVPSQQTQEKVYDFTALDQHPNFPGGMDRFYKYLAENVKYPSEALKNKVQGKVFLSFVVEKDGTLTDVKVERKLGSGTDEEAVRVIKESPRWFPGVINKQVVRVKYNLPISFTLTK